MGIDGSGQTLLTDVPGVTQAPKLSADGQTVYFEWLREGKASLARMPIAGGPIEEVESLNSIPSFTSYYWAASPDGKFIAHSIWDTEEQRIKVAVDAVGSGQRVTVLNIWPSLILKWMPDGKSIFYRSMWRPVE
jgi:Tol biopolymer transport system component